MIIGGLGGESKASALLKHVKCSEASGKFIFYIICYFIP